MRCLVQSPSIRVLIKLMMGVQKVPISEMVPMRQKVLRRTASPQRSTKRKILSAKEQISDLSDIQ